VYALCRQKREGGRERERERERERKRGRETVEASRQAGRQARARRVGAPKEGRLVYVLSWPVRERTPWCTDLSSLL